VCILVQRVVSHLPATRYEDASQQQDANMRCDHTIKACYQLSQGLAYHKDFMGTTKEKDTVPASYHQGINNNNSAWILFFFEREKSAWIQSAPARQHNSVHSQIDKPKQKHP
jgi:hypothetical protein